MSSNRPRGNSRVARWKKLLGRMLADTNPVGYSYGDAAGVLQHLNFVVGPVGATSHRKWRGAAADGTVLYVGLVDKGAGHLKPWMIREMLDVLRPSGLIPTDLLEDATDE